MVVMVAVVVYVVFPLLINHHYGVSLPASLSLVFYQQGQAGNYSDSSYWNGCEVLLTDE